MLFLICLAIMIGVSRAGPPPPPEQIRGLTLASLDRQAVRESWNRTDIIATATILGLVAAIYLYFSFWI